jgi:hypothetical protein
MKKWMILMLMILLVIPSFASASHNNVDLHSDNIELVGRGEFSYGTDMAFHGNLLVAGSGIWDSSDTEDSGVLLYSIANPEKPELISHLKCGSWHADVGIWKDIVVQSHDSGRDNINCSPGEGKEGIRIIDISNRNQPKSIAFAETIHGSHNLTVVGDTGYVYISSYKLADATALKGVSIVDINDPHNPTVKFLQFPNAEQDPNYSVMKSETGLLQTSPGCHDIGVDMEKNLAFCGGITETQIWDITNPADPVIITTIVNPAINIHHGAYDNKDGDILIIDDEFAGAAGGPSACTFESTPTGALWFYDISDPRNPVLQSYWSPDMTNLDSQFCTSHFFGVFPDRDWVAGSWYESGLRVVDFSDPTNPVEKAFYVPEDAVFWAAYPYKGYIYANSFSPATLTGSDPAKSHAGGIYIFKLDGFTKSDSASSK